MKIFHLISLAALLVFSLDSCTFDGVEIGKINGIDIVNVGKETLDIELKIPIVNPNKIGFTISRVNIYLALNGVEFGRVTQKKKIHVKPKSSEVYPVLFQLKLKESVAGLPKLIAAVMIGKRVDMKAEGYVKARKFFVSKKFEINEKTPVNLFNKKK